MCVCFFLHLVQSGRTYNVFLSLYSLPTFVRGSTRTTGDNSGCYWTGGSSGSFLVPPKIWSTSEPPLNVGPDYLRYPEHQSPVFVGQQNWWWTRKNPRNHQCQSYPCESRYMCTPTVKLHPVETVELASNPWPHMYPRPQSGFSAGGCWEFG